MLVFHSHSPLPHVPNASRMTRCLTFLVVPCSDSDPRLLSCIFIDGLLCCFLRLTPQTQTEQELNKRLEAGPVCSKTSFLTRAQCGIVAPEAIFHTISTSTSVRNVSLSLYTASVRLLSARIISVMTNDINGTHLPVPLLMRCRKSNQTSMRGSF